MPDVLRSVAFRAADDLPGDGQTLEGYAAVFGADTEIDSWEGSFIENIRQGAFRKTIRENTPVMQFDHGHHPLIGSIPIGTIESLAEDEQGLYVRGRLTDNWLIQPVRDAISSGAVNGMSFRFQVMRDEWRDGNGKKITDLRELEELLWDPGDRGPITRTLLEVRMMELGPVVFPAYPQTSVGVRASQVAATILRDRDLSRGVRKTLAAGAAPTVAEINRDEQLRREVAAALLFPDGVEKAPDAPPDGHPSTTEPRQDAGLFHTQNAEGTPPDDGHLPEATDAPPTQGHPPASVSRVDPARIQREANFQREYLALILKGSERYDHD